MRLSLHTKQHIPDSKHTQTFHCNKYNRVWFNCKQFFSTTIAAHIFVVKNVTLTGITAAFSSTKRIHSSTKLKAAHPNKQISSTALRYSIVIISIGFLFQNNHIPSIVVSIFIAVRMDFECGKTINFHQNIHLCNGHQPEQITFGAIGVELSFVVLSLWFSSSSHHSEFIY